MGRETGKPKVNPLGALWFTLGLGAMVLGGLGIVVPLVPTTPFLLVAAFAFARSSRRWSRWLLSHPLFGPIIQNWRQHGAIAMGSKSISVASMAAVFALSLALRVSPIILVVQGVVLSGAALFVLSRPLPPHH